MAYSHFSGVSIVAIAAVVPKKETQRISYKNIFGNEVVNNFMDSAGVEKKKIASKVQTASDLGFVAARQIIDRKKIDVNDIKSIVFLSRTPDYRNPSTAAVLQYRLGLQQDCLAYDVNIGNAGFIYGLQIGCSLTQSMNSKYCLLIIGDTSSKQVTSENPLSMLYGDAATAILLEKSSENQPIDIMVKSFGDNYNSFIIREGGFRLSDQTLIGENIFLNSSHFYAFVEKEAPPLIDHFLEKTDQKLDGFDLFSIHQEHKSLLKSLMSSCKFPHTKTPSNIQKYGNTSGASIPLLLVDELEEFNREVKVLACAYGEGTTIGIASFTIDPKSALTIIESDEVFDDGAVSREV
jgi:3-oxoacyl-[acyl-carrier-protein] synthase-3